MPDSPISQGTRETSGCSPPPLNPEGFKAALTNWDLSSRLRILTAQSPSITSSREHLIRLLPLAWMEKAVQFYQMQMAKHSGFDILNQISEHEEIK